MTKTAKRLLSFAVVATMSMSVIAVSACGKSEDSTTKDTITVWCPEERVELTTTQLNNYAADYESGSGEEFPYEFTVEAVGEGDAATNMITDVTAGGDIFFFAQDQIARLVSAGALAAVSSTYSESVSTRNDSGSVAAATVSNTLYAYPISADNGYFAYYDTSVLSEEDFADQTTLIEACQKAGKTIAFEITDSAWYLASYFFATGCVSEWATDNDGNFISYHDTWCSDAGVAALLGAAELINSDVFVNSSSASSFSSGAAVVVDGTWDYETAKELLGDNLGCRELWEFTVDGTSYHLGSYSGYKLMGVKPQTDATKLATCQSLANYLTGETCQLERFEDAGWGPSNINAASTDAVKASPHLSALAAQSEYSTPQGQYPNSWWDYGKAPGASVQELGTTTPSTDDLWAILNTYAEGIATITDPITEIYLVGSGNIGWVVNSESGYILSYDNNEYSGKTEASPTYGIWTFEVTLSSGDMFRVCDKNWSTYVGYSTLSSDSVSGLTGNDDDNIVVAQAGVYKIVIDTTTSTITVTLLESIEEETHACWVVVGDFSDASWDTKAEAYLLVNDGEEESYIGTWSKTVTLEKDGYVAIVQYGSWDNQIGYTNLDDASKELALSVGSNSINLAAGTYTITLVATADSYVISIAQA